MKFSEFLKDRALNIFLLIFAVITIEIFLLIYDLMLIIKIYIPIIILLMYFIGIYVEFYKKKSFYNKILNNIGSLDQKYLISEIVQSPEFLEGKILYDLASQMGKSMLENVNKYKYISDEYKEYIELWIHEIKLPIATSKLIIENNKNDVTKNIDEEINKIDNYVEQALYYARSSAVEKDYLIRKTNLKDVINKAIKKNKNELILKKIKIDIHDIDTYVYTDSKWIMFILNQIIANSIKYSKKDETEIEIFCNSLKDNVILHIKDNGIGVRKGEITRVFEKGFTGTNGRMSGKKSTGIGLYLCKNLCQKLNINIEFNSVENVETEVKIVFPRSSYTDKCK